MKDLKVGDLVRDKLNEGEQSYGLGIVTGVRTCVPEVPEEGQKIYAKYGDGEVFVAGNRYNVYFTRFGRTIEFHGEYLERV